MNINLGLTLCRYIPPSSSENSNLLILKAISRPICELATPYGYTSKLTHHIRIGGAIVLMVNLLVFPISSERQLRETLVVSLEHIATFSHLLAKTYTLTITDEERKVRDRLNQSIRVSGSLLRNGLAYE